jgi:hypothetical protein
MDQLFLLKHNIENEIIVPSGKHKMKFLRIDVPDENIAGCTIYLLNTTVSFSQTPTTHNKLLLVSAGDDIFSVTPASKIKVKMSLFIQPEDSLKDKEVKLICNFS